MSLAAMRSTRRGPPLRANPAQRFRARRPRHLRADRRGEIRERVIRPADLQRALAARYGLPYNSASLTRQFGSTWLKNLRLAFP